MESIQPGLETVGSLKIPVDEDIDPLERAPKENKDVELGEEEAIVVVTATWSISSVTPIQQNLPPISTPIHSSSKEKSNKTSRGKTSPEKIEKMLENRSNKIIQRKLPKAQTSTKSEEEKFWQNLLERMERLDTFFEKVCKAYKRTYVL